MNKEEEGKANSMGSYHQHSLSQREKIKQVMEADERDGLYEMPSNIHNLTYWAKMLGYKDVEHLEINIENYGEPLSEWWNVIKSILTNKTNQT